MHYPYFIHALGMLQVYSRCASATKDEGWSRETGGKESGNLREEREV
jgi:hypothetical protein